MVMILAIVFRFAFAFWLSLLFIAIYYIGLHLELYKVNVVAIEPIKHELTYNALNRELEAQNHVAIRVKHRNRAWAWLLALTCLILIMSYPSQFLYTLEQSPYFGNFAGAIRETIWISFFIGDTYVEATSGSFFAYCWGYYFLLFLLVLERKS